MSLSWFAKFPMASMLTRIMCYLNALLLIMWASDRWFGDSYTANLSLFTVFSFTFEMLWAQRMRGARLGWYVTCVVGLALCGVFLMTQAMEIEQDKYARRVFNERVQSAVSNVDGAVLVTNEKGAITAVNDGLLKLTGYSRDDLVGKSIAVLFPGEEDHVQFRIDASRQMHSHNDPGWVIRGGRSLDILTKQGKVVRVTKYIVGLRSSVDEIWPNDIQFITIFVAE